MLFVLQMAVILVVTRICGWLVARIGQPQVVGEIAGGILLGPIGLGFLFPASALRLFPSTHMHPLETVSNIGLVLFLFLIGSELDLREIRNHRQAFLAVTGGSVGLPFFLGIAIAPLLFAHFATFGTPRIVFLVFIGIAMSITALPVLARILQDREQQGRPIPHLAASNALMSAGVNDVLAWSGLGLLLAMLHAQGMAFALLRIAAIALFTGIMFFAIRPLGERLAQRFPSGSHTLWLVAAVAIAFSSAALTDALGIHAFFGALLAGICVPRTPVPSQTLSHGFSRSLQPIIRFTLPVFFAMTGLRMQRLPLDRNSLGWLALIVLVATIGKIVGGMLGAKTSGLPWKIAATLGILLNTRGLVELIVLNIGYREKLLTPQLFTLFVLMAVITTAMTAPLLQLTEKATAE